MAIHYFILVKLHVTRKICWQQFTNAIALQTLFTIRQLQSLLLNIFSMQFTHTILFVDIIDKKSKKQKRNKKDSR
jgi:hypothetical protein